MDKLKVALIPVVLIPMAFLLPVSAYAYVGPGAGLSLLGALWALIAAIATALIFVIAWPIRRMLRRRREAQAGQSSEPAGRTTRESGSARDEDAHRTNVTRLRTSADDEEDRLQPQ